MLICMKTPNCKHYMSWGKKKLQLTTTSNKINKFCKIFTLLSHPTLHKQMIQTNLCHTKKEQNYTYYVQHIYDCYVPLCTSKRCKIVVRAYYTNVKLTTYIDEPNSLLARTRTKQYEHICKI
jgi:hypothetical protein